MTTNKEIMDKLEEHGEVLARLDERTKAIKEMQELQGNRVTYLERKDTTGTIITGVISGITAIVVAIHTFLGGGS